jgi:uric acid transporter
MGERAHERRSTTPPAVLRYKNDDRPPVPAAALFGVQHVLIMFGAMIGAPLVIGQLLDLTPELRQAMIVGVMFGCGVGTLVSALGLGPIGGRLPLLLGAYTVYIGPFVSISRTEGLAAASGAVIIGGFALLAASRFIGKMRHLFPPIVVGIILVITGVSLVKVAAGVAFAVNTPQFGRPVTFVMLFISLISIVGLSTRTNGLVRSLSIFITLMVLYLVSALLGITNTHGISSAPWFRLPQVIPYGVALPSFAAVATILIYYLIAAIYTMSITLALCGIVGVAQSEKRVSGAVAADGFGSLVATALGGVPLVSYDQNVGAISLTGVGSRFVVAAAGAILVFIALIPKAGAFLGAIPPFILGGTLIFMFGMIVAVGIRMLAENIRSQRDIVIVAATVGVSAAISFVPPAAFDWLPAAGSLLATDGIVVGTIIAVSLEAMIPRVEP